MVHSVEGLTVPPSHSDLTSGTAPYTLRVSVDHLCTSRKDRLYRSTITAKNLALKADIPVSQTSLVCDIVDSYAS